VASKRFSLHFFSHQFSIGIIQYLAAAYYSMNVRQTQFVPCLRFSGSRFCFLRRQEGKKSYQRGLLSDTMRNRKRAYPTLKIFSEEQAASMPYRSIRETAEEIHSGIMTPTELVLETLERIDEQDGKIQAYITVMRTQALQDAEKAEQEMRTGLYRGPLHGIPLAIKDIIAVKGVRLTAGSQVLAERIATEDASVVELLRKKGAIILGKTALYEFAYGPYSPPTRNPWNTDCTTGGSSGGSAAAVIMEMCLGAIGTDTGGSIRIPSACCGVTGLKPTYGRVSCHGVIPLSWSLDHVGPIGRCAEDCALLFDAIAGYDPRDPNSVSGPPGQASSSLIGGVEGRDVLSLQGVTLGIPADSWVAPLNPEVHASWKAALRVLQEAGAEIIEIDLPLLEPEMYRTIQRPEATLTHQERGWFPEQAEIYGSSTRTNLLLGQEILATTYLQAQQQRKIFTSSFRAAMQAVHALVLPTIPVPAYPLEQCDQEIEIDGIMEDSRAALLRLTKAFNLTGLPAISLPCGFSTHGLPFGLQIAGKPFEEAMILRIAHAYQQITDWHRREIATS
jgi:aspartyl-tRNA(Asn)/glutamyl-tRNA(Gln) amidotransferase subunit A